MDMTMTICNVATSAMVKETKAHYITRAGVEIGVASTKAFTTQLAALYLLALAICKEKGRLTPEREEQAIRELRHLPKSMDVVLKQEPEIKTWAELLLIRTMHCSSAAVLITQSLWKVLSSSKKSATSTLKDILQVN